MADGKDPTLVKETLDKDLAKIGRAEAAVQVLQANSPARREADARIAAFYGY